MITGKVYVMAEEWGGGVHFLHLICLKVKKVHSHIIQCIRLKKIFIQVRIIIFGSFHSLLVYCFIQYKPLKKKYGAWWKYLKMEYFTFYINKNFKGYFRKENPRNYTSYFLMKRRRISSLQLCIKMQKT